MVRFYRYLKLEPKGVPDGLDIASTGQRNKKNDLIFSGFTNFELPVAEVWKTSR